MTRNGQFSEIFQETVFCDFVNSMVPGYSSPGISVIIDF